MQLGRLGNSRGSGACIRSMRVRRKVLVVVKFCAGVSVNPLRRKFDEEGCSKLSSKSFNLQDIVRH